jgi:nucleoside phosphorylase
LRQSRTGIGTAYTIGGDHRPVPVVDIAIVTVLDEEYAAVYRQLESPERINGGPGALNQHGWILGTITSQSQGRYQVVLALGRSGNVDAAIAAGCTINAFRPDCLLMVGIAGAVDSQLSWGDVAVSDRICGYEYGKLEDGFHPRPDWSYPADQSISVAARTMATLYPDWAAAIDTPPPEPTSRLPRIVVGPIASGDKVVDDLSDASFGAVLALWPRLVAVEMEGLGGVKTVDDARERGHLTHFSMIRGISDCPLQATSGRTQRDRWKPRAAATAAAFTGSLIRNAWPRPPRAVGTDD